LVEINADETLNTKYYVSYVCNLVEEVEPFIRLDPQSENNDADEGDRRRAPEDAQSDPEYEPKDNDDDDSSGEDDDDESQDDDVTLQPVRRSKRKSERYASKIYGKSTSLEPKRRTTNTQKKSKTLADDTKASSARLVSCPICNKQFKGCRAKRSLKRHLDIHAPESKFPCPHCPARFKQNEGRNQHIKRIHLKVKPVKKFTCQFCAKKFRAPYLKKEHERVSNLATTDFEFLCYYAV
jgi:uncharacterized Zn-finger protein